MDQPKISFKVPPGLWHSFTEQTRGLFLTRAPFLNHMISAEVVHLRNDLAGRTLSLRAKRHISGALKRQGANDNSVNIEVEQSTADQLNEVVRKCNLVRDAFLCRLIVFLRGSDSLLKHLEVPLEVRGKGSLEAMPTSPLKAMEAVRDDPLFYIRHHVKANWDLGIYTVPLPRNLDWMACYLEDKDVPGTKANEEDKRSMAELFALSEADAFAAAAPTRIRRTS